MICKCGKECAGPAFAPTRQDWEYGTPRSPYLLYEVCEHGTVTVDNRSQAVKTPGPRPKEPEIEITTIDDRKKRGY